MSILIKGMKMPKDCTDCPFKGFDRNGRGNVCIIDKSIDLHACLYGLDVKFVTMGDCPLIELPDHGDLIDRDAALRVVCSACYDTKAESRIGCDVTCYEFDAMMDLPIVIPAERSEE